MAVPEAIIDENPDAIVVSDSHGTILRWNRAAEKLFGWDATEAIGRNASELIIAPEIADQYREAMKQLVAASIPFQGQRRITVRNREQRRIAVRFWYHTVQEEGHVRVIGFFRDSSQSDYLEALLARQRMESRLLNPDALHANEDESFESALLETLHSICEITHWPIGRALLPSDDEQTLLSTVWTCVDKMNEPFCEVFAGQAFRRNADLAGQVWETGQSEWQRIQPSDPYSQDSGHHIDIRSQYCVAVRHRREVIAVLQFFLTENEPPDVGLRNLVRKLSRALGHTIERRAWEEERRRLAAIVESTYDAILSKDPGGIITSWNKGAERLYGFSADEAVGQSIEIILPGSLRQEEREIQESIRTGQRLEQFETQRQRKSGEVINVSLTLSPLMNEEGRVIGTASIERDITRRKEAQHRLQEAMEVAEAANLAKSEFLANISHELRTPMNAILGMTDLSLKEELPEDVRDYLETVRDSADTMLFLINEILDFSRLEAGRFELENAPFDIRGMLDQTLRALSFRAHEKGLELVADVSSSVPQCVVGDEIRLQQILSNLTNNAIKFTESGEVVVTIGVEDVLVGGSQDSANQANCETVTLTFCVRDTGIGISPEDHERIFAPFTQADASTTRSYAGTGLGLSICRELATLMGGQIRVESRPGSGSSFFLTVTFLTGECDTDRDATTDTIIDDLSGTAVLIVDDNETIRANLKDMVESWSMRAEVAESGDAALRALQTASSDRDGFSLLIVDAVMPGMDGVALLEHVQNSAESNGTAILMMSPADQRLFKSRIEHLDVGAFLDKPVSQSSLLGAISEAFGEAVLIKSNEDRIVRTRRPLRILVAEDIPANQKVVKAILAKRGHSYRIAHNGREAIDFYTREAFDAILMDVQMPIMDGLQAVRAIRSSEGGNRHIPIVAMTAHAMRGDRETCLAAGMDAYVAKPIDAALLLNTLERLTDSLVEVDPENGAPNRSRGQWTLRSSSHSTPPAELRRNSEGASETTGRVWHVDVAMSRMGDDVNLLAKMVDFFLEDSGELQSRLSEEVAVANWAEAKRIAHSLKGLCSNFEAAPAVAAAFAVERACSDVSPAQISQLLTVMKQRIAELTEALRNWQAQH
ncbi:MAG: response regulator [Planctomycetaceae bacterium]|nr:response regulator [Planctomycetaceae bacterium]